MQSSLGLALSAVCTAVSWTLYGLVTSNLGKQEGLLQLNTGRIITVPEFLYDNFHYRHDMLGYIVLILAAFVTLFWTAGWAAFRYLNFNVSPRLFCAGLADCCPSAYISCITLHHNRCSASFCSCCSSAWS